MFRSDERQPAGVNQRHGVRICDMSRYDEKKPRLEYYSQQFAKRLFARHPEWKPYAGFYAKGEPGLLSYYLEVEIPSANPHVQTPLVIRTNSSPDVMVSWMDGWHFHVSP